MTRSTKVKNEDGEDEDEKEEHEEFFRIMFLSCRIYHKYKEPYWIFMECLYSQAGFFGYGNYLRILSFVLLSSQLPMGIIWFSIIISH